VVDVPHQQLQIRGDKDRCQRILAAVIDNALKFSPPNSNVDVTLTVTPDSAEVSVTDRGIGIAEEHRERIFDRFFQVGGAMDRPQQGFGLGLYIVKRVTESLGGEVRVSSEPGKGATFKVILPTMPRRSSETQIKATGADS
jgi:two-component system sensor histidine kinase SenX3